jgi:hypothetical protein
VAFGGLDNPSGVPIGYAQQVEIGNTSTGQRPKPYLLPAVKRAVPPYKADLRASIIRSWEKNIKGAGISGTWKTFGTKGAVKFIQDASED